MTPHADRRDLHAFLEGRPLHALDRDDETKPDLTEADLTTTADDRFADLASDVIGPWLD